MKLQTTHPRLHLEVKVKRDRLQEQRTWNLTKLELPNAPDFLWQITSIACKRIFPIR